MSYGNRACFGNISSNTTTQINTLLADTLTTTGDEVLTGTTTVAGSLTNNGAITSPGAYSLWYMIANGTAISSATDTLVPFTELQSTFSNTTAGCLSNSGGVFSNVSGRSLLILATWNVATISTPTIANPYSTYLAVYDGTTTYNMFSMTSNGLPNQMWKVSSSGVFKLPPNGTFSFRVYFLIGATVTPALTDARIRVIG